MGWFDSLLDFLYNALGYHKVTVTDVLTALEAPASKPLPNQTVTLFYRKMGTISWSTDGTNKTNEGGFATMLVWLRKGQYDLRAVFNGAPGYDPVPAEKAGVTV